MNYWVLYGKHAIGPFPSREAAHSWAGEHELTTDVYAVKSDIGMENYPHKERLAPE